MLHSTINGICNDCHPLHLSSIATYIILWILKHRQCKTTASSFAHYWEWRVFVRHSFCIQILLVITLWRWYTNMLLAHRKTQFLFWGGDSAHLSVCMCVSVCVESALWQNGWVRGICLVDGVHMPQERAVLGIQHPHSPIRLNSVFLYARISTSKFWKC